MRSVSIRLSGFVAAGVFACVLTGNAASMTEGPAAGPKGAETATGAPDTAFEAFLDRLMRAESNGQDHAANPRSTALGPFQFIKSTFIEVARRHFVSEVATLNDDAVLALRTNRGFARRAATAFCKDNLALLSEQGLKPTFGHLRLAFLVGPSAAARLLQAAPATPVAEILGSGVITANPFMRGRNAADLIARAARDVGADHVGPRQVALQPGTTIAGANPRIAPRRSVAAIAPACSQKLASCRRWVALRIVAHAQNTRQKAASRSATSGRRDTRRGA